MKRLFIILAFFCLAQYSRAQDSLALQQQKYFQYLNDSTKNKIECGCGYSGRISDNLYLIRELIADNRFNLITNLLDSKIASTRYLAALSILRATKKSRFKPDSLTMTKIEELKQDNEIINFCRGCTGRWSLSIKTLLDKKEKPPLSKFIQRWIDDSLKHKR